MAFFSQCGLARSSALLGSMFDEDRYTINEHGEQPSGNHPSHGWRHSTLTIASACESAKATAERLLMGPGIISMATRKRMGAGSSDDVTANCCTHSPTKAAGAGGKLSVRSWMAPLYVKPPDAQAVCLLPSSTSELLASTCQRAKSRVKRNRCVSGVRL